MPLGMLWPGVSFELFVWVVVLQIKEKSNSKFADIRT